MLKKEIHIDTIYLAILGCISSVSIYRYLTGDYVLSINNYAAFILLTGVIIYKIVAPCKGKHLVLGLLILSTLNIINFSIEVFRANIEYGSNNSNIEKFGINFVFLLILISYIRINKDIVKSIYQKTEEEAIGDENKRIDFYYTKFINSDPDMFNKAVDNIEDYPSEAQIAINKIKEERSNNIQ